MKEFHNNVLSGLNIYKIFTRSLSVTTDPDTVFEFSWVALDSVGGVILPPYDGFFPVYLVLSTRMSEPSTKSANAVSLMYGNMRIITDKVLMPVQPGDLLYSSTTGYLKTLATPGNARPIGIVEQVIDSVRPIVIASFQTIEYNK